MPTVRLLDPDEWNVYREIRLKALTTDPDGFAATLASVQAHPEEEWRRRLVDSSQTPEKCLLFAFRGETPVGMIGAHPGDDGIEMVSFYVTPEARRQGVGKALIKALMERLRSAGFNVLTLTVHTSQRPAISLYEKLGFSVIKEEGRDVTMRRELS